jgi:hypothetical protein
LWIEEDLAMGSTDVQVREQQLRKAEARLAARKALLEGRGLDAAALVKDTVLRKLEADLRKAQKRVEAPKAAQAHVEKVAAKIAKAGKKKPAGKKPKGGKQAQPAGGKGGKQAKGGGKGAKGGKGKKK